MSDTDTTAAGETADPISYRFSLDLKVFDEGSLRQATYEHALKDGLSDEDAKQYLDPDASRVEDCQVMLLDPSSIAGGSIYSSEAEVLPI